jgi:hypothetical protein
MSDDSRFIPQHEKENRQGERQQAPKKNPSNVA